MNIKCRLDNYRYHAHHWTNQGHQQHKQNENKLELFTVGSESGFESRRLLLIFFVENKKIWH